MPPDAADHVQNWVSLGDVLAKTNTLREYAALYDTVESSGIYRLDPFNRAIPFAKDTGATREALCLILKVWNYESGAVQLPADEQPPLDNYGSSPDDLYVLHGWPAGKLPEFKETGVLVQIERPTLQTGETKKRYSLLVIIAGLLHSKQLDPNGRETTGKIVNIVGAAGLTISDDKVREVLKELPDALARRKAKRS
jgi:hypothetical protein